MSPMRRFVLSVRPSHARAGRVGGGGGDGEHGCCRALRRRPCVIQRPGVDRRELQGGMRRRRGTFLPPPARRTRRRTPAQIQVAPPLRAGRVRVLGRGRGRGARRGGEERGEHGLGLPHYVPVGSGARYDRGGGLLRRLGRHLGCGVWCLGLGFGVYRFGFRVLGLVFRVEGLRLRV